ncbi:MAG: RagB/SusD family nutrient uptake outer membrane protein, partial [Tannerellaceae bacterium]|nr:RagB/SusD family nutrient uptake outer membrane protein [Tannerellaceae bacterium]
MKNLLTYAVFLTFFFFIGCNDEENSKPPAKVNVEGRVEKGPFVNNSVVTIQELSESLTPTGRTFQTNIKSDDGTFILNDIELESSYVLLTANGYFFNEVQGKLSSAPLTLHALADLNNGTSVNVNLLSHLKKERLTTLMKNESLSYDKANQQAQTELLSNFGLQKYVQKEVSSISITDVSDEAAALIVISSTLLSLYDNSEARLTEGLTKLSDELKENGTFSATNKEKILEESTSLDWDKITDNIIDRYEELGKEVNIQD